MSDYFFSSDVVMKIAANCGPKEMLALRATCKSFEDYITKNIDRLPKFTDKSFDFNWELKHACFGHLNTDRYFQVRRSTDQPSKKEKKTSISHRQMVELEKMRKEQLEKERRLFEQMIKAIQEDIKNMKLSEEKSEEQEKIEAEMKLQMLETLLQLVIKSLKGHMKHVQILDVHFSGLEEAELKRIVNALPKSVMQLSLEGLALPFPADVTETALLGYLDKLKLTKLTLKGMVLTNKFFEHPTVLDLDELLIIPTHFPSCEVVQLSDDCLKNLPIFRNLHVFGNELTKYGVRSYLDGCFKKATSERIVIGFPYKNESPLKMYEFFHKCCEKCDNKQKRHFVHVTKRRWMTIEIKEATTRDDEYFWAVAVRLVYKEH